MKTSVHETGTGQIRSLLLLFIRASDDLPHVVRQVGEFLVFCRSRQGDSFASGLLLGAWIDGHAGNPLMQKLMLRLPPDKLIRMGVLETFSLLDIWSVVSIESSCPEAKTGIGLSHDSMLDALLDLAQDDSGTAGRYSPAFALDTPRKQVHIETRRLNTRYPFRIGQPIYHDRVTGGLSPYEE